MFCDMFFNYFRQNRKYGYWPVICGVIIWAAFMNWNYFGLLQTFGKYAGGDPNINDFQ